MNSTPTRYTLKEIVDFCYLHKRERGFKGFNYLQIIQTIKYANDTNRLYVVHDEKGLCGVCTVDVCNPFLYVDHIVCVRNGFKTFIAEAQKRYPGLTITGLRRGKLKMFEHKNLRNVLVLN